MLPPPLIFFFTLHFIKIHNNVWNSHAYFGIILPKKKSKLSSKSAIRQHFFIVLFSRDGKDQEKEKEQAAAAAEAEAAKPVEDDTVEELPGNLGVDK